MHENTIMHRNPHSTPRRQHQGVVLPIALIMLVIISFAGLLAARNSATFEQFSNNMRTNQVARVSAESALRRCERIAIDSVDSGAAFPSEVLKIVSTEIPGDTLMDIQGGFWNIRSNWVDGAANLITYEVDFDSDTNVSTEIQGRDKDASCIIQAMVSDRFLITARGLSSDAVVEADGTLSSGSEVWLQSILTPTIPTLCANGGACQ